MKKIGFALLFLILTCSVVLGRAEIAVKNRVKNQNPGYCAWAAIETLCRHEGIKAGYDLVEARKKDPDEVKPDGRILPANLGYDESIAKKLTKLGIKYQLHPSLLRDEGGIYQVKDAVANGHGAVIAVFHGRPTCEECHAVVVVDCDEDGYDYVDSNDVKSTYHGSWEWFRSEWTGFVLTVEK